MSHSMDKHLRRRELLKLSKIELIKKCKEKNLSTSGNKGDLVLKLIKSNKQRNNLPKIRKIKSNQIIERSRKKQEIRNKYKNKKIKISTKKHHPQQQQQQQQTPISLKLSKTSAHPNDQILDANLNLVHLASPTSRAISTSPKSLAFYTKNEHEIICGYDDGSTSTSTTTCTKKKKMKSKKDKKSVKSLKKEREERIRKRKERKKQSQSMYDATRWKIDQLRNRNDCLNGQINAPFPPISISRHNKSKKNKKNKKLHQKTNTYLTNTTNTKNKAKLSKSKHSTSQTIDLEAYFGKLFGGLSQ